MTNLNIVRNKLDEAAVLMSLDPNYIDKIIADPQLALSELDIADNSLPLYAWNPAPSAITACPTCLFKGPIANPHTHADCPPRPNPQPSPTPSPQPTKK
jgi:hypothetical protein